MLEWVPPCAAPATNGPRHERMRGAMEFDQRARLYASLDRRLASHTRFFGAAAVTNALLADLFSRPAGRICMAAAFVVLVNLGRHLQKLNMARAHDISNGAVDGADLDSAMVSMEQSEVQAQLARLRSGDPRAYARTVSQMDRMLNLAALRANPAMLCLGGATYAGVLRVVGAELGRAVSFAHQHDRECIGRTLITRLRTARRR
jgi:hypothetical protein